MVSNIIKNKISLVLALVVIVLVFGGGFFVYQRFLNKTEEAAAEEVDLAFDPEGPYAILSPRRDGNALVLNLKRTASYDKISYELAYNAEGIDRGVMGEINTKDKKGEYEQEILFGTCSKNVCKYDKGVENGTLTLHIQKGKQAFRMVTQWHLQRPDIALGVLTSGDNHMTYKIDTKAEDLTLINYSIINDLSGAPKLPSGKQIVGKVYSINSPVAKTVPKGEIGIESATDFPNGAKIARFDEGKNAWVESESKVEGSKISANIDSGGVVTVFAPKN